MKRLTTTLLLLVGLSSLQAQVMDWYGLVIIPEIKDANFLVVKVDSIGAKCQKGRELVYCTEAEMAHDSKLVDLRRKQFSAIDQSQLSLFPISIDSLDFGYYKNKEKYRYLIDYDYDLLTVEKTNNAVIYLKLDFLLIDRKTNEILGRSLQYDLQDPFGPMDLMIDELLEINSSE